MPPKTISPVVRFFNYVELIPFHPCWEWIGSRSSGGYGKFFDGSKLVTAHRWCYELLNKKTIPTGLVACHICDNRTCVNPSHIFIGTKQDNTTDMVKKRRDQNSRKTHCIYGHPFNAENTIIRQDKNRQCRTCNRIRCKNYHMETRSLIRKSSI